MFTLRIDEDTELRLLEERHAQELFDLIDRNRDHLKPWMTWVDLDKTVEDVREAIRKMLRQFEEGTGIHVGIWRRGKVAGGVGTVRINREARWTEIGYWLGREFQGMGLMTKACRAMIAYFFQDRDFNRVEIRCAAINARSCAMAERLGFRLEGRLRQAGWIRKEWCDLLIYGLLRSEWPGGRDVAT